MLELWSTITITVGITRVARTTVSAQIMLPGPLTLPSRRAPASKATGLPGSKGVAAATHWPPVLQVWPVMQLLGASGFP